MPDDRMDPSQNTQAFQAWVDNQPAPLPPARNPKVLYGVIGAVVLAVVVVVVAVLALA